MSAAPKRRWFRFSVRLILAATAIAAVASWLNWGLPRYASYQKRMQFEAILMQVDGDMEKAALPLRKFREECNPFEMFDDDGGWVACEWPTLTYFLYFPERGSGLSANALEIYRLANAPENYAPKSGRRGWSFGPGTTPYMENQAYYWGDFYDFLCSDRQNSSGFKFELLRAVPTTSRRDSEQKWKWQ
jgi:hypothetical protein